MNKHEVAGYETVLASGTDAKYKFKQASKLSPSRMWIPKHHLILKLKPFHFSSKLKPEKKKKHFKQKKKQFRIQERRRRRRK